MVTTHEENSLQESSSLERAGEILKHIEHLESQSDAVFNGVLKTTLVVIHGFTPWGNFILAQEVVKLTEMRTLANDNDEVPEKAA